MMEIGFRKYFWTFDLLLLIIGAVFVAKIATTLLVLRIPEEWKASAGRGDPSPKAIKRNIKSIIKRNIFCSSCEPTPTTEDKSSSKVETNTPLDIPKNLRLIATLICEKDPAWSFAAIQNERGKTGLLSLGSSVGEQIRITAIEDRQVKLAKDGRVGVLRLDPETRPSTAKPPLKQSRYHKGSLGEIARGIHRVGNKRYEISRAALNTALRNTALVARGGRIVPVSRRGKRPGGVRIYDVREGSLYQRLGIQSGDFIQAINGRSIDSPDKLLPIYNILPAARHLTMSFVRRGKTITHDYIIR